MIFEFRRTAIGPGCRFCNQPNRVLYLFADLIIEMSNRSFQYSLAGHNIPTVAAMNRTDRHYYRIERTDLSCHNSLKIHDRSRGDENRINPELGLGPVRLFSLNANRELFRSRHFFAFANTDFTCREGAPNMGSEDSPAFFKPIAEVHHIRSSDADFFSRLENKIYRAGQFALYVFKHLSGAQQHSNMIIMTASVHDSFMFRRKVETCIFRYGQGIDISS